MGTLNTLSETGVKFSIVPFFPGAYRLLAQRSCGCFKESGRTDRLGEITFDDRIARFGVCLIPIISSDNDYFRRRPDRRGSMIPPRPNEAARRDR